MTSCNTSRIEVDFFGETYIISGHKPAKSKVSVITTMPSPTTKKQVQSLIGIINYLSKFSLRLSEFAELTRKMSKEKVPFHWRPKHQAALTLMKQEISSDPILAYYNPKEANHVADRCKYKRPMCFLLQEEKPVYFASKALTEAQKGYVAIEIELVAVAWAMEKFHHFLYACHFILETNQKLLEAILSKSLNQATPILQWILIRTFAYPFTVRYIPGVTTQLKDSLTWPRWPKRYHKAT